MEDSRNPWKGLRGMPRNMWILFFTTLINRTGTMVLPFLTLYLTNGLKEPAATAGLVLSAYGAGALITSPLVGKLCDYFGALKIMKLSLLFSGLLLFIYAYVNNFILIMVVTVIWAVVNEAFRPANLSLISTVVQEDQRRTAFALNRLAINLGMSIGPVAAGILSTINFRYLFYIDGITSIAAFLFLLAIKWQYKQVPLEEHPQKLIKSSLLRDRNFLLFLLALLPVEIIFFQHFSTFPIYLTKELGFPQSYFGFLIAINTIMIILIEVPLNTYLNFMSDKHLLILGSLLTAIGFGAMAYTKTLPGIAITIVLWTFGEMIFFPSSANFTSLAAPEKKKGEYMGYFQMTFNIAFTVGPWIGTKIWDIYGSFILWNVMFIAGVISILLMLKLKNVKNN